jgi:hypothetical protein
MRTVVAGALLLAGCAILASTDGNALVPGHWSDKHPGNGVVTGKAGGVGPLTVCRAKFDNGWHPGKVWQGQCHFEWGWVDHVSPTYQVLLDNGYTWQSPFVMPPAGTFGEVAPQVPDNAVDGGDAGDAANHSELVVCQAFIPKAKDKTWHPGKFYAGHCNIAWGGPGGKVSKERHRIKPDSDGNVLILVKPKH